MDLPSAKVDGDGLEHAVSSAQLHPKDGSNMPMEGICVKGPLVI